VLHTFRIFLCLSAGLVLAGCGGGGSGSADSPLPPAPVSGLINIEAGSRVDQDTMDQLGLQGARPATRVQALPASFVLAGYVSGAAGVYPASSTRCQGFDYQADEQDQYTVPMGPGDTLVLESFGSCEADPRLELQVEDHPPGNSSVAGGLARFSLPDTAPARDYRVTVRNTGSAPARYILFKAAVADARGLAFDWPRHRMVAGEAVVELATGDDLQAASAASVVAGGRPLGQGSWLMTRPAPLLRAAAASDPDQETLDWVRQLRARPGVISATPNYLMSGQQTGTPVSEPLYPRQWHYDLINAPAAWQLERSGGSGVRVAVLDSGLLQVSPGRWHPDLAGNVVAIGPDYVDGGAPVDPGSSVGGDVFHGTHVAGTIAAVVNGSGSGGVAYGAGLVPVRVLGEGGTGSSADLIAAINWLVAGSNGAPRAEVVNMSLGGLPAIPALERALAAGVAKGMLFVAAAGNSGSSARSYPAVSGHVLGVSAVDGAGRLAGYSNFGNWIDLAAPGGDASRDGNLDGAADLVWSTSGERASGGAREGYRGLQGTSMAAPHVSGVLALMKARQPDLNHNQVRAWLQLGELTDGRRQRSDSYGWGLLDAARAVSVAGNGFADTVVTASPAVVSLSNEGESSASVALRIFGDGAVSGLEVKAPADWVSVAGCDGGPPCTLRIDLRKHNLTPGEPARSAVTVAYQVDGTAAAPLVIPVIGQLISDSQARNAGRHFVLLVDTEPNEDGLYMARSQLTVTAENGEYAFRFVADDGEEPRQLQEVEPGDYYLVAGSDLDGDGIICQPGEACAEYPIAGMREIITIREGQSLSDLRLTTSFSRPTISAASPDVLPRPGFQGYRLMDAGAGATDSQTSTRMTP